MESTSVVNQMGSKKGVSISQIYGNYGMDQSLIPVSDLNSSYIYQDARSKILAPIITRIAMDVANIPVRHVNVDENGLFLGYRKGVLDDLIHFRANIDQTGTDLILDAVKTVLEYGTGVFVPADVRTNPERTQAYGPLTLRVGTVTKWYGTAAEVLYYDRHTAQRIEVTFPKGIIAIFYNPLSGVMNSENSTLARLADKVAILDKADARANSSQLDLLLQLPFSTRHERQREEAERRMTSLETQMENRRLGAAYIDATDQVIQLNRPVTDGLAKQVSELHLQLYHELGLSEKVFNGTASSEEYTFYLNRTVLPILTAIATALGTTFLTRTAVSQGQAIMPVPNVFKLAPLGELVKSLDLLSRNEFISSNTGRQILGLPPVDDADADKLSNKNINKDVGETPPATLDSTDEDQQEGDE